MPRDISNCKNIKKVMSLQKLLPSNGEKKALQYKNEFARTFEVQ